MSGVCRNYELPLISGVACAVCGFSKAKHDAEQRPAHVVNPSVSFADNKIKGYTRDLIHASSPRTTPLHSRPHDGDLTSSVSSMITARAQPDQFHVQRTNRTGLITTRELVCQNKGCHELRKNTSQFCRVACAPNGILFQGIKEELAGAPIDSLSHGVSSQECLYAECKNRVYEDKLGRLFKFCSPGCKEKHGQRQSTARLRNEGGTPHPTQVQDVQIIPGEHGKPLTLRISTHSTKGAKNTQKGDFGNAHPAKDFGRNNSANDWAVNRNSTGHSRSLHASSKAKNDMQLSLPAALDRFSPFDSGLPKGNWSIKTSDVDLLALAGWDQELQTTVRALIRKFTPNRPEITPEIFSSCLQRMGICRDLARYFTAFDRKRQLTWLSQDDVVLGLASLAYSTPHTGIWKAERARYIFRFYAEGKTLSWSRFLELAAFVADYTEDGMKVPRKTDGYLRQLLPLRKDSLTEGDFVSFIMADLLEGATVLFRESFSIA